jgi:hypothetical protein
VFIALKFGWQEIQKICASSKMPKNGFLEGFERKDKPKLGIKCIKMVACYFQKPTCVGSKIALSIELSGASVDFYNANNTIG